jgi:hypothetical protein
MGSGKYNLVCIQIYKPYSVELNSFYVIIVTSCMQFHKVGNSNYIIQQNETVRSSTNAFDFICGRAWLECSRYWLS